MSAEKRKKKHVVPILILIIVVIIAVCVFFGFRNKYSLSTKDIEIAVYVNTYLDDIRENDDDSDKDMQAQLDKMLDAINTLSDEGYIDSETIVVDDENGLITYTLSSGIVSIEKIGGFDENLDGEQIEGDFGQNDISFFYEGNGKSTDAIILNGMTDRNNVMEKCISLAENWSLSGVSTNIDRSVTLDDLCNLKGYEFIYVKMHGGYARYKYKKYALGLLGYESITTSYIYLEQKRDSDFDKKYESDLAKHKIGYMNGCYFITPDFFNEHYKQSDFANSIFFLGCCELMGSGDDFTEAWTYALQNASVQSFVAFHNSNYTFYNLELVEVFMNELIKGECVQNAFDCAIETCGENDEEWCGAYIENHAPAYPLLRGNTECTLCWERTGLNETPTEEQPGTAQNAENSNAQVKTNFDITGSWKSVGSTGFGQAQPGAVVTFDGTNCNFYSPNDTYLLYQTNGEIFLECTSMIFSETLRFNVDIYDDENIQIQYGSTVTDLKRVYESEEFENYNSDFKIEGSWKSVGDSGFGQAQPGTTVTFDGEHCNFYSPYDTYNFYYEDGKWKLSCKNVLWQDVLTFTVEIIDNNKINIYYGSSNKTILER